MLSEYVFDDHVIELENYYNKPISDFVRATWLQTLSPLSDEQFIKAVAKAIATEKFFPTAKQLLDLALGEARNPGENWIGTVIEKKDYLALPSAEINASNITYEQQRANLDKAREMAKRYRKIRSKGNWIKAEHVISSETEKSETVVHDYKAIALRLVAQWKQEAEDA